MTRPPQYRKDCEIRLNHILDSMGDVSGKSLIDVGCANGYFIWGFINAGGDSGVGIEKSFDECAIAEAHGIETLPDVESLELAHFDYGLFLDLYFHSADSDKYLSWLKEHCHVVFVSPSGDGEVNNARLEKVLTGLFDKVEPIYKTDYANRMIYRCE